MAGVGTITVHASAMRARSRTRCAEQRHLSGQAAAKSHHYRDADLRTIDDRKVVRDADPSVDTTLVLDGCRLGDHGVSEVARLLYPDSGIPLAALHLCQNGIEGPGSSDAKFGSSHGGRLQGVTP